MPKASLDKQVDGGKDMKPDSITLLDASGVSLSEEVSIRQKEMSVVNQQMWDGSGPERIVVMESQR